MCKYFLLLLLKIIVMNCKYAIAAAFIAFATACSNSPRDHEADDHGHASETGQHLKGDLVQMPVQATEKAGIVWQPVSPGEFREAVKTAGIIENSRGAERVIAAPAAGIVSFNGDIVAGKAVAAGQSLFSVSSKGLEQADPTATLQVNVSAAKKALDRAESLIKDNLITRTEYESLRADYERALAASATIANRTARSIAISSPMSGYLVDVAVSPGQFVEMGQTLATVAIDRRLLLRADLSERHRNFVPLVAGANILLPESDKTLSLAALNPKVLTAGSALSGNSHFIPVYIEFDNPGGLGNGSVVEAWLLGPARPDVIAVPKSALVEDGGYFYVYVRKEDNHDADHDPDGHDDHDAHADHDDHDDHTDHDAGRHDDHFLFEKREVRIGASDGEKVEITAGLASGEEVVISGAPRIRMAGMGSSIQGHSHHH